MNTDPVSIPYVWPQNGFAMKINTIDEDGTGTI